MIAREAAAVVDAEAVGIVVRDGDRRWCLGAAGPIDREWHATRAPPGWIHRAGSPIHSVGSSRFEVGEVAVFATGTSPGPFTEVERLLETFARIVDALVTDDATRSHTAVLGVALVDEAAVVVGASRSLEDALGWGVEDRVGTSGLDLIHPDDWTLAAETFSRTASASGRRPPLELRLRRADGSVRAVEVVADNRLDDPSIRAVVLEVSEPSEPRMGDVLANRQSQVLRLLAQEVSAPAVGAACTALVEGQVGGRCQVLVVDEDGSLSPLTGRRPEDAPTGSREGAEWTASGSPPMVAVATELPVIEASAGHDGRSWWAFPFVGGAAERVLGVLDIRPEEARIPSPDDRRVIEAAGQLAAVALARACADLEAHHELRRDAATGLPNRAMLLARLEDPNQAPAALLVCHLAGADLVRRTYGHETAADVLAATAERAQSVLRHGDIAFRSADDELAIALTDCGDEAAALAAARKVVNRCHDPLPVNGRDIYLEAIVGVAMATPHARASPRLLTEAELATHRARTAGTPVALFRAEILQEVLHSFQLEAELRHALRAHEFVLHYQPKVELPTGRVMGVEALLRWGHPQRGLIPPDEFIPALESSGLIVPVSRYVLEAVCQDVAGWAQEGLVLDAIEVNASPAQLDEPSFVDCVLDIYDPTPHSPTPLVIEITESVLSDRHLQAQQAVLELAKTGVRFAIDDFGTGYSSLARLQDFPIHELKIDRTFTAQIDDNSTEPPAMLAIMLSMAHRLDVVAIAEGVETEHQARVLTHAGCDFAQGFHFARPAPAHAIPELVASLERRL